MRKENLYHQMVLAVLRVLLESFWLLLSDYLSWIIRIMRLFRFFLIGSLEDLLILLVIRYFPSSFIIKF